MHYKQARRHKMTTPTILGTAIKSVGQVKEALYQARQALISLYPEQDEMTGDLRPEIEDSLWAIGEVELTLGRIAEE